MANEVVVNVAVGAGSAPTQLGILHTSLALEGGINRLVGVRCGCMIERQYDLAVLSLSMWLGHRDVVQ